MGIVTAVHVTSPEPLTSTRKEDKRCLSSICKQALLHVETLQMGTHCLPVHTPLLEETAMQEHTAWGS